MYFLCGMYMYMYTHVNTAVESLWILHISNIQGA